MIRHANPRDLLQHGNAVRFLDDLTQHKCVASKVTFTGCPA